MADIEGELSDFGYPCVIKPLSEGSSLGVKVLMGPERLSDEYKNAYDLVLLERFIEGKELSVAVLDGVPLAVVELTPHNGFYDYENKYTDNKTTHTLPASVPAHVYDRAMKIAADAHELIGARGLTRSDFRYNPLEYNDNKSDACGLYFLEINTHPGLTPLSLAPEMAAYAGISFSDLVDRLIKAARCDH
jgi:D-alanine-D-alanine ligase